MLSLLLSTPVTLILLILNVLVSFYALYVDHGVFDRFSFRPTRVAEGEWYRLLTGGFLHAGLTHLLFNMFTLFFFGPWLELALGSWRFAAVYFGAELAAHAFTYARHRDEPGYAAVGASGAISGVIFAFCLFAPLEPIYIMFIPVGIPAVVYAVLFVLFSAYAMREGADGAGTRIAHDAHLGGAIGGLLLTVALYPAVVRIFLGQLGL
jgi:membrane associated rhomboid family serine protease